MTDTSSASKAVSTESTEAETGPALKVAIIAGGLGHERDVSLRSGRRIAQTLIDQGFTVRVWDLDPQLVSHLQEWEPDVVWPLVHGADGENGALQDLLRVLQIPYVGADGACSRLASSKPAAKALLTDAGIATPVWVTFSQSLFRQVGAKAVLDAKRSRGSLAVARAMAASTCGGIPGTCADGTGGGSYRCARSNVAGDPSPNGGCPVIRW